MTIGDQVKSLRVRADAYANSHGADVVSAIDSNSALVLQWLPYLVRHKTGSADELLDGVSAALVESAACAALGLVRPALFAMRTEVDVILAWLYFKDHRVEWENVNSSGDGFKLKKELFEYYSRYFDGFGERYGLLRQTAQRKDVDTYRFLSAHIHAQSKTTLPIARDLASVVGNEKMGREIAQIASDVDEYINDVLLAFFISDWAQIPPGLVISVKSRFKSEAQKKTFFGTL